MTSEPTGARGPDLGKGIASSELAEGGMLIGHASGEEVLLTRHRGTPYAVGSHCAHYGAPLADGMVVDGTIRCPWHHAAYDLRTGDVVRPPALDGIPCWEVVERDGVITVAGRKRAPAKAARSGPESIVIVGGGAAGHYAAETLRREGYDRPIAIVEMGPSAPYDRPNLSKDYLAGSAPEDWIPLRPDSFYAEHGIELLLDRRAVELDASGRRLTLGNGTERRFGALLIATGSEPIPLEVPGAAQPVYLLRTLADSRAIIAAAARARHAVVVGASFIGLEVAASLRARGIGVTVVAPDARPLERVLGPEVGDAVRAIHESHGVTFRLGRRTAGIARDTVTLDDGEVLRADLVVAGIGVRPRVQLAERAGLAMDRGIVVDGTLRTSAPDIFAAGDVARWPDPHSGERIRVEHWAVAQRQGQAAARNMLGAGEPYAAVPFFWSQHHDVTIAYSGHAERWDRVEIEGDLAAHDASVTYRVGGRVAAFAAIGRDRASLAAEVAMESAAAGAA